MQLDMHVCYKHVCVMLSCAVLYASSSATPHCQVAVQCHVHIDIRRLHTEHEDWRVGFVSMLCPSTASLYKQDVYDGFI